MNLVECLLTIADLGTESIPCSSMFLVAILDDLEVAISAFSRFEELSGPAQSALVHVFAIIFHEVKRLLKHKALFTSSNQREAFFDGIRHFLDSVYEIEMIPKHILKDGNTLTGVESNELVELEAQRHRPTYDKHRTVWQQFMHHHSPGTGIPAPVGESMVIFGNKQIVPPGGRRILLEWEVEIDNIKKSVFPVCSRHPTQSFKGDNDSRF